MRFSRLRPLAAPAALCGSVLFSFILIQGCGNDTPSGPAGSVKIAAFTLGDQRYRAIEAGPFDPQSRNFSIMVECDTQEDIDRLWDALTAGGKGIACGWLTDRWGITWQITPKRLLDLMNDPDRAKAKRVMEAARAKYLAAVKAAHPNWSIQQ